uniref:Cadherin domain-containing protein n=1 Tax=Macrostomum lignano TaxID=282301 RepID=A0A1I8GR75_9PLAT
MRPNVAAALSMDSNGTVYSRARFDYDVPSNTKMWFFTVICTENATSPSPRSSEVEVAVQLPTLTPESTPVNTEVYRISAIDSDSPVYSLLEYTLSGTNSDYFNVSRDMETNEAVITLIKPMDYESLPKGRKQYSFTISVSDGVSGPSRRATSTVVIGVQNVNDNAPLVKNFTSVLDKNAPAATSSQYPSATNSLFAINQVTGMVSVSTTTLMDQRSTSYILPFRAIDDGTCEGCPAGTQLTSEIGYLTLNVVDYTAVAPVFTNCPRSSVNYTDDAAAGTTLMTKLSRLSVSVKDINDNPPFFPRSSYAFSVREDVPIDYSVGIINATDPDVDDTLRYSIESGDPKYEFMSIVNTGEIRVAKELDFHVTSVSAIDKDSPSVTYSLSGRWTTAPTAYFTVDPSTGVISTTRPLDREEQPVYRFNALATDGELIRYAQIFVWPVDLNDNRPTWNFTSLHGYLYDNSPVGTNFMRISVIDADITGTIVYALLPVPNNTDTSEYVTVSGTGPRGIFTFLVTATDGVGTPITGTASVTITDVNDNAPVFDRTTYSIDIPESTEINDNVFTAAATDVDEIDFGRLRYTLPDNPPYFNITNIPTINGGAVLLAKALDYDDASVPRSFSFRIVVIDSAPPPFSATCTLSINVIDVNDNTPVITFNPSSSVTKEEGPRSMGVLVSFTATDADPTDRVLIFSILSESDPYGNLEITGVTGTSGTINVRLALDREVWNPASTADAVHMYVLLASDQRGRTGTATLTVTITDINDTPPTLALPNTVMIMEGSAVGTFATPSGLTAVDRDKDINGGPFTYTQDMAAGNNWTGRFALQLTGSAFNIQAAKVLDRETDGKIFLLSVLITDRGGLTGTGTVTVIVGDADDNRMVSNGHKQVYVYIYEGNEDYFTGSDPYRPEHMELGISESRLVYRHNLGDYVFRSLTLPNANVSDGAWHWVQIIRRLADVEIIMDKGEFYNYAYMLGNYTSVYNNVILGNLAAVGAVVSFEVAFLIWYCCFAAGKSEPLLIDAPFENVVDYNEEGGGQEDKLNFDMAQLRVMVTDTTIVQEKTTNLQSSRTDFMSLLQGRLAMANAGPEPSPFDGVLDYEYEGRGAKADDLDSIVSGDDNATQNFDFLQSWGPKFERVTNIYTTLPDNADDLQSVSEVAGPSSAARSGYTVTTTTTTTKQL